MLREETDKRLGTRKRRRNYGYRAINVPKLRNCEKCLNFGTFSCQKKLGRKFGLAKFYFGLIRFVCDLLLVTAKLNNNNTEFVWWWVVVVVGGLQYP